MPDRRRLRCAIYTRKSSEEGLEQDFNSLDAQREACEAYVRSQKHEGWTVLPTPYDDGGFSGGSMDRPGLQKLLADIASGQIDVVVVYKVDRLTRAIMDFARIVEVFDRHGVSFVSVTQAFNTTTSMGRLTLNVLLSFAQFEREVTGERIRDKIAASKKKGLWMGGWVPLGYRANGRTLAIDDTEAETVRTIYAGYLELKSVDALKEKLDREGLRTAVRSKQRGDPSTGLPFSRGHLYRVLSNPLYAGEIRHKGQVYDGQHPAIIDRPTWDAVRAILVENNHRQLVKAHSKNPSLLAGLLHDAGGERFVATHARRHGKRYRYYVSGSTLRHRRTDPPQRSNASSGEGVGQCWRLPATEIETVVIGAMVNALRSKAWLLDRMTQHDSTVEERRAAFQRGHDLAEQLEGADPIAKRGLILALLDKVVLGTDSIEIRVRVRPVASGLAPEGSTPAATAKNLAIISKLIALRRRGSETKLIIEGEGRREPDPDPVLVKALAQAHRWWGDLLNRRFATMREIAQAYSTHEQYVARIIPLAFLSPKRTQDILEGRQAVGFTLHAFLDG